MSKKVKSLEHIYSVKKNNEYVKIMVINGDVK